MLMRSCRSITAEQFTVIIVRALRTYKQNEKVAQFKIKLSSITISKNKLNIWKRSSKNVKNNNNYCNICSKFSKLPRFQLRILNCLQLSTSVRIWEHRRGLWILDVHTSRLNFIFFKESLPLLGYIILPSFILLSNDMFSLAGLSFLWPNTKQTAATSVHFRRKVTNSSSQ